MAPTGATALLRLVLFLRFVDSFAYYTLNNIFTLAPDRGPPQYGLHIGVTMCKVSVWYVEIVYQVIRGTELHTDVQATIGNYRRRYL
eukprot:SAG22_NODE_151_length_17414_cov_7.812128_8_plen_87_part_00